MNGCVLSALLLSAIALKYTTEAAVLYEKRVPLSAFDTLGGIGLGKRSTFWIGNNDYGLEKRAALSSFDTLGGIGLGKRSADAEDVKRALSSFDTLGGIGLGKRSASSDLFSDEKRATAISAFDSLGGIGLGKRSQMD